MRLTIPEKVMVQPASTSLLRPRRIVATDLFANNWLWYKRGVVVVVTGAGADTVESCLLLSAFNEEDEDKEEEVLVLFAWVGFLCSG